MDRLPYELLHMTFAYLRPRDVTQARLVCKSFAEIGSDHLLSSYHLVFTKASFRKLLEISQHPIVSKSVKSILYEADNLRDYETFEDWKMDLYDPFLDDQKIKIPPSARYPGCLDCSDVRRRCSHLLKGSYDRFRTYIAEQKEMQDNDHNAQVVAEIMRGLSNLKSVGVSIEQALDGDFSDILWGAFSPCLHMPFGDNNEGTARGISQLRVLLSSASDAGIQLQKLRSEVIGWHFFNQKREIFAGCNSALQALEVLELRIAMWDPLDYYINDSVQVLKEGRLRDFLTAAPNLTDLILTLEWPELEVPDAFRQAQLVDVVGTFRWSSLRRAYLGDMEATEKALIDFYSRHAETLKDVGLSGIYLTGGADWANAFLQMAKLLRLEGVSIGGLLRDDIHDRMNFGFHDEKVAPPVIRNKVEFYLLHSHGKEPPLELQGDSGDWDEDWDEDSDSSTEYTIADDEDEHEQWDDFVPEGWNSSQVADGFQSMAWQLF